MRTGKHRRNIEFELGDFVYLNLRPYNLPSLANRINQKLSRHFYGPFKVVCGIGQWLMKWLH